MAVDQLKQKIPRVKLEAVTAKNWQACTALSVAPNQRDFVPSNLYSIAEAQFYPEARSRAVVSSEGTTIGYTLFGRDIHSGKWKIFRIMIDVRYQGSGYGFATMQTIIAEIAQEPDGDQILICYQDKNVPARRLYRRLGFQEISVDKDGKATALRTAHNLKHG